MNSGYSIFHDTMADMTFTEVSRAARDGAIVLWGLGVIEEHGPHLPLATDVYLPYAILREARRELAAMGRPSILAPLFYWGVNGVSAAFPGSFVVRAEVMIELMKDVFRSLRKDGFERVVCLSGHNDAAHNVALLEGVRQGRTYGEIETYFVAPSFIAERLGFANDEQVATYAHPPAPPAQFVDVHAGAGETSAMWGAFADVVREEIIPTLAPTNYGPADLVEWRQGAGVALRKTPDGYFGDPAAANAESGAAYIAEMGRLVAAAISAKLAR